MSLADYASGSFPVLAKLANLLRHTASAIFRFSALLRREKTTEKSPAGDFDRAPPAIATRPSNAEAVPLAYTLAGALIALFDDGIPVARAFRLLENATLPDFTPLGF